MDKPEALRLADDLEDACLPTFIAEEAAAELRRLHHTVAAREDDIQTHSAAVYEATRLLAQAREQRDALLEALKWIADHDLSGTDLMVAGHMAHGFIGRARAAVSAFEGAKV